MSMLRIFNVQASNDMVSGNLFQTNLLLGANTGSPWFSQQNGNPAGSPTSRMDEALDHFGVSMIRYPGGGANDAFAGGMMVNGALPDHVVNILTYAQQNRIAINMVVPVDTPTGLTRAEFLTQMSQFAAAVQLQFPGVVKAYELGNEYWGGRAPRDATLEAVYGANAGGTAVALGQGMAAAGYDANVFLQASGNLRGAFGNSLDIANGAIQRGFGSVPGAMDVLDGVIRNNYWRADDIGGFANSNGIFAEDRGLEFNFTGNLNNWEDWIGRDLIRMVGEYNINRNIGISEDGVDMGIHGASFMLEHMANMIDAGVDKAFAWPLIHNTQNALLFRNEAITTVSVHDMSIATNTTRIAILDLMRQTLTSHELVHADWSFGRTASDVEVTLFREVGDGAQNGQGSKVVFLSSRNPEAMNFTADLSGFVGSYDTVKAIGISYEADGSHQRDAIVREVAVSDPERDGVFTVELQPYEVVQFIFDIAVTEPQIQVPSVTIETPADPETILGTDGVDRLVGTAASEVCYVFDGNDIIFGRGGNDAVFGGAGNDFLRGNMGSDSIDGGDGNDTLHGDVGNDNLMGGAGNDVISGGFGRDRIWGGVGNDTISGGGANDRLFGENGRDLLFGNNGNDILRGGAGADTLHGGAGNDRLFGGKGRDLFVFEKGHDHDVIADFDLRSGDRIDFSTLGLPISPGAAIFLDTDSGLARQVGSDVVITTSATSSVTLKDINLALLNADHFIL